jgi:hypothetical protein
MRKRLLGVVDICGLPFKVWWAGAQAHPTLERAYGVCYPQIQEIWLDDEMAPDLAQQTLVHEGMHGIWTHSGCGNVRADTEHEENVIRILSPHLRAFMRSVYKIKFPR